MLREAGRHADELEQALCRGLTRRLETARQQLAGHGQALDALSPLGVLERGYSLTTIHPSGELVRSVRDLQLGQRLAVRVSDGRAICPIEEVQPNDGETTAQKL